MSIGNRISELRKKYNYSQEYVAEQLDVSRQAVSKWEQDQTAPDTNNLIALAKLFGVSVEYLATGKEIEVPQFNDNKNNKPDTHKKIISYILLGAGLLALILGFLFSELLLIVSVFLIVAGITTIIAKKNTAIWVSLSMAILWTLMLVLLIAGISSPQSAPAGTWEDNVNASETITSEMIGDVQVESSSTVAVATATNLFLILFIAVDVILWCIVIAFVIIAVVKKSKSKKTENKYL